MNYYLVYDGRAVYDEDAAAILDCIGEATQADALAEFKREWADVDAVLFEYDVDGDQIHNGRRVFA